MCASVLIFLVAFALATTRTREQETAELTTVRNVCRRCDYPLDGLEGVAVCPECGAMDPKPEPMPIRVTQLYFDLRYPGFQLFCFALMLALTFGIERLNLEIAAYSYVQDGYLWSTARNAARVRDSGRDAFATLGWPLATGASVLPLCGFADTRRRARIYAAVVLAVSASVTLAVILA